MKRGSNLHEPSARRKPSSRTRRIVLLAGGGLVIGILVVTVAGAVPHQVEIDLHIPEPELAGRECVTVVSADSETVAEASELVPEGPSVRLQHSFWLAPEPHRVEVRVTGCPSQARTFDPRDTDRVTITYRCTER